ncbi:MAG TPA: hypothetical protein VFU19_09395 [Iamia sp.]|nr:hypothetical protein [Iamia sp.]
MPGPAHCDGCGRPSAECPGCRQREYDPPRFCPTCGLRLAVVVSPAGHRSRCKVHGEVAVAGPGATGTSA